MSGAPVQRDWVLFSLFNRNLVVLFFCQMVAASGSILLVTLGGIIGGSLAGNPALATLPLSIMVVGTALTTVPASMLMRRIGRRNGFLLAAAVGCCGALIGTLALFTKSFGLFCVGTACYGFHLAFVLQYRFAAAESVSAALVSRAISLVLLGSIGGAFLGPLMVTGAGGWVGSVPYAGTMLALAGALVLAFVALLALRDPALELSPAQSGDARPLAQILRQPLFVVAVLAAAVGYAVMTFIMTATPLSMHLHAGFNLADTSSVVRSHVIAMYAPSLVSGYMIEKLGVGRMMATGAVLMLVTIIAGFAGQQYMHYWIALVALGVGWNFLFIGGTTLLTRTYRATERFRAQAVNDFSVFALSATASLLSGTIIQLYGWQMVMASALPPLLIVLAAIAYVLGRQARAVA